MRKTLKGYAGMQETTAAIALSDKDDILQHVREYGLAVVPSYVSGETLEALRAEFEQHLHSDAEWIASFDYSDGEGCKVFLDKLDRDACPATASVFGSQLFRQTADAFLGGASMLNHEIYCVRDVPSSEHIAQDLHYDRIPTFKFFIYLTDTTAENGAFHAVPGSHKYTKRVQKKYRKDGILPPVEVTRDLPEELASQQIPIEGPAGTLIVFDTDTFHRAGKVRSGERLVMRGHTRLPDFRERSRERTEAR